MSTNFDLRLYAVTDRAWVGQQNFYEQVEEALKSGVTMLQLREKDMEESKFIEEAEKIKKLTDRYKVPLIINDNISVALACDAAGVHIGQEDMPIEQARELLGKNKILGVTAKTVEQARQAQRLGADYLGSGAVFGSSTKKNAKPMSTDTLLEITKSVQIPVVAIGGISSDNISLLNHTGIAGVAVASGIFSKENIAGEVYRLRRKIQEHIIPAKVLTIAGSDCSGGAGIQADLKTMQSLGAYGMSVITALTAQNTTGVYGVVNTKPEFVEKQIQVVLEDIFPDAIKLGMISTKENALAIANTLKKYSIKNLVIDPVMISTSGSRLILEDAIEVMEQKLFPLATVITPNIPEAEYLCGFAIDTEEKMQQAAEMLSKKYHTAILLKGGHQVETANDILYQDEKITWFNTQKIENPNTHGTGCRLSSAIAANLAMGESLEDSIKKAKEYLTKLISQQLNLGKGSGPLK